MSAIAIASVAGVLLSLIFSYVPGFNVKYAELDSTKKSLIMLGLLVLVAAGSIGIACAGIAKDIGISVTCDKAGFIQVGIQFVLAVIAAGTANQATYKISPETNRVQAVKANRE